MSNDNVSISNRLVLEYQLNLSVDICKDINRWLSPSNVTDDLTKHLLDYMEGSCKWLTTDSALENVLAAPEPSVLAILAQPGAGKTTAAAFLIRHLTESVSGAILYFFCKSSDAEKRTTLHILRSLLWQCLQYDRKLYSAVVQWYYQSGRCIADSQTDVGAMLNACLQATALPAIFVVIDAFDECLDKVDLLRELSSAMSASARPLKLIVFSRDDIHLPDLPSSQHQTLRLTADRCQASIEYYVKQRLANISSFGGFRHDNGLAESISHSADGLWPVARVPLDVINHAPSLGEVHRQISGLPHELRSLYSSILTTKEMTFSEVQMRMAQEIFLWINTTEYMPEWHCRDSNADCLEDETICSILTVATGTAQLFNPPKLVGDLASPLLEVRIISPISAFD